MILKQIDVLPHGLFNNISKLGANGEKLRDYLVVAEVPGRIPALSSDYVPDFQVDVYGTIGEVSDRILRRLVSTAQNW